MAYHLSDAEIGLVGVALGFVLSFGAERIRDFLIRRKLRQALDSELRANLRITVSKRDILKKVEEFLPQERLLSPSGVRFASQMYLTHFSSLAAHSDTLSRNSLHVIYESQRIFDEICDSFDTRLLAAASKEDLGAVTLALSVRLPDLKQLLSTLETLIAAHIAERPVDVLHVGVPLERIKEKKMA